MTTLAFLLHPLDVLLFRDARPFTTGDSAYSTLPTPQTWAGAIKTHLHHRCGLKSKDWHNLHEKPEAERDWKGLLKFRGPWLYVYCPKALWQSWERDEKTAGKLECQLGPVVPTPADVVKLGKEDDASLKRLRPLKWEGEKPIPGWKPPVNTMVPLWIKAAEDPQPAGGFLDVEGLKEYLNGGTPQRIFQESDFFERERRTGIGVDPATFAAKESLIYSASFLRLRPGVCFYAEVDWPDNAPDQATIFQDRQCLSWGGEGRRVEMKSEKPFAWENLQPRESNGQRLSLLVTPGIFSRGNLRWHPREQGTLKAAAVPKPLPISGWDMAGEACQNPEGNGMPRPKPTRFAVPAGAAYFWQNGRNRDVPPAATPLSSLCDKPQDQDTGWGLALWGHWTFLS